MRSKGIERGTWEDRKMNQRRQWRSENPFTALYVDDGEELEVPAGSLLERVTGPLADEIPAGDATRFDLADREDRDVSFDLGGRRLKATWKQFHIVGDCVEI